jgi:type 1 glutamine amidotransferase
MKALVILFIALIAEALQAADTARVLIVVGPSKHPPGSHEVAAGGRLMKHCIENMSNLPGIKADVVEVWPDKDLRDAANTVVFIGDTFPANRLPNAPQNLADLDAMMQRGCGIVCVHYATGLLGEDVTPEGDHPLLRWMGGYFANRSCKHHESFAKIFPTATITPAATAHPTLRGWKEFTLHDEPYTNNFFGRGNIMAPNVTALATSMLPPETPKRETVAWCVERPDSGRGFGIVMPHFYKNWRVDDLRRFILNGIVWTTKLEVPAEGVQTSAPDLAAFKPDSIEYVPPPPKVKKAAPVSNP